MKRRYLSALVDNAGNPGALATAWEGWANPFKRALPHRGKLNPTHPLDFERVENCVGCYAILYVPSSGGFGDKWVAYVGFSKRLQDELYAVLNRKEQTLAPRILWTSKFAIAAVYISSSTVARAYELDLIRYYCPPWNVRFSKQPK